MGEPDSSRSERLKGHVAIVTGGSSGIGLATCKLLATEGADIVVVGRNAKRIENLIEEIGHENSECGVLGLTLDVRQERDMDQMSGEALARFGRIDFLIACAGIGKNPLSTRLMPYSMAQLPTEEWDVVLGTNLTGIFLSNRSVLPTMIKQRRGVIVNVSSCPGGLQGQPFASVYCASKFGVIGLSEALAEEVSAHGVKVQAILPDATDTPLLNGTTLSFRRGRPIPSMRVAEMILYMLLLPKDVVLRNPVIAPY